VTIDEKEVRSVTKTNIVIAIGGSKKEGKRR
jgi:hypothetical protein